MNIYGHLWNAMHFFGKAWHYIERMLLKRMVASCGENVSFPHDVKLHGYNLHIGNNVALGAGSLFMCTRAPIYIGDNVMFGPRVTVITGNHRTDYVGKYMIDVKDPDKLPENDQPVVFEGDNWIGANATILKGVTVGRGSVIGAGAVVTKDVPPYSIYVGVPQTRTMRRFDEQQIEAHERILQENGKLPDAFTGE